MGVAIPQVISEDRAGGALIVDGSLRFDKTKTQYLSRTISTPTSANTWTFSCWIKRNSISYSEYQYIFSYNSGASRGLAITATIDGNPDCFYIYDGTSINVGTARKVRDASGWYHLVLRCSSGTGTLYLNGESSPYITASSTMPSMSNGQTMGIGILVNTTILPLDAQLSNAYFIDGQALDPSYFGYTDPLTNVWRPKKLSSSVVFGTNGFYLPFDGSAPIGQDQSGRGNNWTPVNFGGSNTLEKATGALPILNTDGGGKVARVGVRTDANASNLSLAIPFIGGSSDVSNQINSGSSTKTTTDSGVTYPTTTTNFYGSSAVYFDSTDTITLSGTWFSDTNFTVEFWAYITDYGDLWTVGGNSCSFYVQSNYISLDGNGVGRVNFTIASGIKIPLNKWTHFAYVKDSSNYYMFIDGVKWTAPIIAAGQNSGTWVLGGTRSDVSDSADWYLQDLRYYSIAKYTNDFIPASTDPDIVPDSPSGVSYSSNLTQITDGAVTFDGSGDYLELAYNSDYDFTGQFTLEGFVYPSVSTGDHSVFGNFTTNATGYWGLAFDYSTYGTFTVFYYQGNTSVVNTGYVPIPRAWNHYAVTRDASNVIRVFLNGQLLPTTATYSGTLGVTSQNSFIGWRAGLNPLNGFISNVHWVKGTCLYTSNFTPPTGPISSVANTKLLCCKSNSSVMFGDITPTATDNYSAGVALTATTYTDIGGSNCTVTNSGSVTSSSAGTNSFGLTTAADMTGSQRVDINMGNVSSTFFQSAWTLEMFFKTSNISDGWFVGTAQEGAVWQSGWSMQVESSGILKWNYDSPAGGSQVNLVSGLSANTWYFMRVQRTPGSSTALRVWVYSSPTTLVGSYSGTVSDTSTQTQNTLKIGDANGNSNALSGNWQFANVMITTGTVAYQNVPSLSSGVRVDNASVSTQLIPNGNTVATNFNPFTVNINTQRGKQSGYATMNPLDNYNLTVSNGNLTVSASSAHGLVRGNVGMNTATGGKYYWEYTSSGWSNQPAIGIVGDTANIRDTTSANPSRLYRASNQLYVNGTENSGWGPSWTTSDTIGVAFDATNGILNFYVNGILVGSPITGLTGTWLPAVKMYDGTSYLNFGQKPFKFPPPAGFQPLTLANTPRPTIVRPDQYVGISTWTGTGAARSITTGFKPDLVWVKKRGSTSDRNIITDSVRGANLTLNSDDTRSEASATEAGQITAFNGNGFSLGTNSNVTGNGDTFVAWSWKAGGNSNTFNINDVGYATASAAGLTAGTITPTGASVNTKSGFSIITWTGDGVAGRTVSHGLGKSPSFIIIKQRIAGPGTDLYNWNSYHSALGATKFIALNTTSAASTGELFNNTEPTNTVFSLGGSTSTYYNVNNASNVTYVSYCWAEIPGFSKFGLYTGNGSTDGPVVITGFKPKLIIMKATGDIAGDVEHWIIRDSTRSPYNAANANLYANLSNAEDDASGYTGSIDILSNGFKLRGTYGGINGSTTYIYAAWAEAPSINLYGAQANAR